MGGSIGVRAKPEEHSQRAELRGGTAYKQDILPPPLALFWDRMPLQFLAVERRCEWGRRITSPMGLHHRLIAYSAFARRLPTFMVHMYMFNVYCIQSIRMYCIHTTPTNDPWERLTQYALSATCPPVLPSATLFPPSTCKTFWYAFHFARSLKFPTLFSYTLVVSYFFALHFSAFSITLKT